MNLIIVTLQKRKSSRFDTFAFDSNKFDEFDALQQAIILSNQSNEKYKSEDDKIIPNHTRVKIEDMTKATNSVTDIRKYINPIVATIQHHRIIAEKFQGSTK